MTIATVYAVFATVEQAESIGRSLVEERLAACVNILPPMRSIYRWMDKVSTADEVAALIKTRGDRADALIQRITELHSYDVPCVICWPIEKVSAAYATWVADTVS